MEPPHHCLDKDWLKGQGGSAQQPADMEPQTQDVGEGEGGAGGGGGSDFTPDELKKAREWLENGKQSPFSLAQKRQLTMIARLNRVDAGEYIKMVEDCFRRRVPAGSTKDVFCLVSREALDSAPAPPADMKQVLRPSSRAGNKSLFNKLTGMVNDWEMLIERMETRDMSSCSK